MAFENSVGKGEIARYEQFLLFPQCFQKTCTAGTYKQGLVWESVKEIFSGKNIMHPKMRISCQSIFALRPSLSLPQTESIYRR